MVFELISKVIGLGNTVYYPGCYARFRHPKIEDNYKRILRDIGVRFRDIDNLVCCGDIARAAGYEHQADSLMEKNSLLLEKLHAKRIITSCADCCVAFRSFKFDVSHVLEIMAKRLAKIDKSGSGEITYFDPCSVARKLGLVHEPRVILERAGYTINELPRSGQGGYCCGAGAGLPQNYKVAANRSAQRVLRQVKTDILVTSCVKCFSHLRENAAAMQSKVKVMELSELLMKND